LQAIFYHSAHRAFFPACSDNANLAYLIYITHPDVRLLSQGSDGRLVDHPPYVLQCALPLLRGLEAASTAAGMLAEYEEDLKMALCQTDDEGQTVMAKMLKYYDQPRLELLDYLLIHGILPTHIFVSTSYMIFDVLAGARPRYSELPRLFWVAQESDFIDLVKLFHSYGATMDEDGLDHHELLDNACSLN
jgi:hypothetical protein